ncbi:MAG TPA: apolipoprotein N-acyltransferase [Acidobacteriaceae bacterium]|nr:apolipoprotein N-acyltransferase [Acidobacteriaceae bacterium]
MRAGSKLSWLLAVESGVILVLPFPVAGPLPHWRAQLAYLGLVPLFIALLARRPYFGWSRVASNTLVAYLCGIVWYAGTCYWIQSTMHLYGNLSPFVASIMLLLFCLFLALYFALFGFLLTLAQRATGSIAGALWSAPFLWVTMELGCARITSFPWNQLGYSQIDNLLLTRLAPWTGTYGISFLIVAGNSAIACFFLLRNHSVRLIAPSLALLVVVALYMGFSRAIPAQPAAAEAILLQPNLDVGEESGWTGDSFDRQIGKFARLSESDCKKYFAGLPIARTPIVRPKCSSEMPVIQLILWPESPAPLIDNNPQFRRALSALAQATHAAIIVGDTAIQQASGKDTGDIYNSAAFITSDGLFAGRYDKIHLVPFGEHVPFPELLSFAGSLTAEVGQMTPGTRRVVFAAAGHHYGPFICYEAIFADEVRQFTKLGADVLVNISDDGWYGDTSAPWQHLNMARMRAIENDRWLLRDTNNGVTAVVDPYGRVLQTSPRHVQTSLAAHFGYVKWQTFYTRHGDVFALLCAIITVVLAFDGAIHNRYRGA